MTAYRSPAEKRLHSPGASLALFGLAICMAPAILLAGAVGGTLAALAGRREPMRPRLRR